jgi:peptidoglycan/xylan/chitin deacetylase (PgdA/CDA1 family)
MPIASRALRRLLFTAANRKMFWPLLRSRATIFMLHRFYAPELGVTGLDPQAVRRALEALRRERFELLPLKTLFEDLAAGRVHARPAVAFTIDDGYLDHATAAAPIFAEFDCPVTTFATTGFLDGKLWMWWDQIEFLFENTRLESLSIPIGSQSQHYVSRNALERKAAIDDFTMRCKALSDSDKNAAIKLLARAAEVEIPSKPPLRYAPMTWADLRRCEGSTMTFGPHTVTHPVLSRTPDSQSRFEITESWKRLRAEAARPDPVWCYPNGRNEDFGEREVRILRELGFIGAVTGISGYANAMAFQSGSAERFRVRRFAFPGSVEEILLLAGGAERLKQIVRRET